MAILFGFFTLVLSLCVVGICVIVLGAIWQSVRADKELREFEQSRRRQWMEPP
jgi:uncharacterized membrane protein